MVDRINQTESKKSDHEFQQIFKDKLIKCFQYFEASKVNRFIPELEFVVKFIYFRLSYANSIPTPGFFISNLQFEKALSKQQKIIYFIFNILGSYVIHKINNIYLLKNEQEFTPLDNLISKTTQLLQKIINSLDFFNFAMFLINKSYSTMLERIVNIKYKYINIQSSMSIDFDLMNKTIIWSILADFFVFLIPFFNHVQKQKIYFFQFLFGSLSTSESIDFVENQCGICNDSQITLPFQISQCGHQFCYYCIKNHQLQYQEDQRHCPMYQDILSQRCNCSFVEIQQLNN